MGLSEPNMEKLEKKKNVKGLIKALRHEDVHVRWNVAEALGEIGWQPKDDAEKVYLLFGKRDWDGLTKIGKPAVELFIQALEDKDEDARESVAEALGEIGDARAVEPLIQALEDKDRYVQRNAAGALGKIGDARAVEPLIQALEDEDRYIRRNATGSLGEIGDARAVEPLNSEV